MGRVGRTRTDTVPHEQNPRACSPHERCPSTGKMFHRQPRCQEPAVTCCGTCSDPIILRRLAIDTQRSRYKRFVYKRVWVAILAFQSV